MTNKLTRFNGQQIYFALVVLLFSLFETGTAWSKPDSSAHAAAQYPGCKKGCVILQELGKYEVIMAISPDPNAISQRVVRTGNSQKGLSGVKCALKSDCVVADEPYFTTCGVTKINCVSIYDRGSYDIIVTWRGLGLDPEIQIETDDEEEGDDESDE